VAGEAGRSLVAGIVGAGTEPGRRREGEVAVVWWFPLGWHWAGASGGGSGGVVAPSRLALSGGRRRVGEVAVVWWFPLGWHWPGPEREGGGSGGVVVPSRLALAGPGARGGR